MKSRGKQLDWVGGGPGVVTAKKNACTRLMSQKKFMQALTSQNKNLARQ